MNAYECTQFRNGYCIGDVTIGWFKSNKINNVGESIPVITVFEGDVDGGGCCAVEVGVVVSPRVSGGGGGEEASSTSWRSMVTMSCCPASLNI